MNLLSRFVVTAYAIPQMTEITALSCLNIFGRCANYEIEGDLVTAFGG
jgi:hypothetical protein